MGVMTWLGFWQLDRAEQKQQRAKQIEHRQQQRYSSLSELLRLDSDIRDFPLQVTGRLDQERPLLWDNRIYEGQVGYEVLAVLMTSEGNLLVNLGWTPAPKYRSALPDVELPDGLLTLQGVVTQPQSNPMIRENETLNRQWPRRIQQPDLEKLESMLSVSLLPFALQVSDTSAFGYSNNWKPVVMPAQKHYGYAVQWFGLALACMVIFVVALYKKKKGKVDEA
ncbi:SURF1 family protein [Lacimicrobium alkaliphilum]|uniref:SURF1 family protein n=1 Tax=Lacimicrobium alkaliphilum TaxID=1526571 RepID=UPI00227A8B9D|nr:SURF1 family protein [Lacimicrobium alkaliphilum]